MGNKNGWSANAPLAVISEVREKTLCSASMFFFMGAWHGTPTQLIVAKKPNNQWVCIATDTCWHLTVRRRSRRLLIALPQTSTTRPDG
tara:strand:+ start:660 stop:923 length:264 start_codon:yes stop_codon:yes gene_type:complete